MEARCAKILEVLSSKDRTIATLQQQLEESGSNTSSNVWPPSMSGEHSRYSGLTVHGDRSMITAGARLRDGELDRSTALVNQIESLTSALDAERAARASAVAAQELEASRCQQFEHEATAAIRAATLAQAQLSRAMEQLNVYRSELLECQQQIRARFSSMDRESTHTTELASALTQERAKVAELRYGC